MKFMKLQKNIQKKKDDKMSKKLLITEEKNKVNLGEDINKQ